MATCGACALALAAWLLMPWRPGQEPAPLCAILVDASASVTRLRPGWEAWVRGLLDAELAQAAERGEDALVLVYAKDVLAAAGPAPAKRASSELGRRSLALSGEGANASELAAALAMLERLSAGRTLAGLRLCSDRTFTGIDPESALERLEARGARRAWLDLPPLELGDLAVTRLDLPFEAEPGLPLSARAWLAYRGPAGTGHIAYEIEVELRASSQPASWTLRGELAADSTGPVPVRIDLGAAQRGTTRLNVRARLQTPFGAGDALPENDRAGGSVRVGDELRIAVALDPRVPTGCLAWVDALASLPGLAVERTAADELARALASSDVLVTIDVEPRQIPCELLTTFLERGGGWLAFAGTRALAGLDGDACVADLIPLDFQASAGPGRDIVLLLDGSGSMAGGPVDEARRAARGLAAAVPKTDRVVLRWFTDVLEHEIDVAREPDALARAREAGGATDIPHVLEQLAAQRAESSPRPALVLLITDGRDQLGGDAELAALRAKLRSASVELAAIAVGPQADPEFLRRLVGPDGRMAAAAEPSELESLLLSEATVSRLRSAGPYEVSFGPDALGALAAESCSPQALQRDALPSIATYLRAEVRRGSSAPWIAEAGEPLLGLARRGLGAAAACATLPGSDWAAQWGPSLFDPLVRWLGRGRPAERPTLRLSASTLSLEDAPADWPALLRATAGSGEELRETVLAPPQQALLDPTSMRAGSWPWSEPRGAEVAIRPAEGSDATLAVLALPPSLGEEFSWPAREVLRAAPAALERSPVSAEEDSDPREAPWGLVFLGLGSALVAGAGLAWGRR
jgi:von Willebrand factor type A domain